MSHSSTQNFIDETLKERKEKFDLSSDDPFIPLVTQAQKVINNQGQTFVQMVLEAKSSERITPEAAADYLNTKAKNLKSVESEIVRFYK